MNIVHHRNESRTRTWRRKHHTRPHRRYLQCCSLFSHTQLLDDLEAAGVLDSDIRRLLARARLLLAGATASEAKVPPWWAR